MKILHVTAKPDHIRSLTSSKPFPALSELIWNGFDSNADRVQIFISRNELEGISSILIRDNGYGINSDKIDAFFGGLGDSWKRAQGRQSGRALHGKNGKGRFKAFALGEIVEWNTVYQHSGKKYSYKITGRARPCSESQWSHFMVPAICKNPRNVTSSLS